MVQAPSRFNRGMKPSKAFSPATKVAFLVKANINYYYPLVERVGAEAGESSRDRKLAQAREPSVTRLILVTVTSFPSILIVVFKS